MSLFRIGDDRISTLKHSTNAPSRVGKAGWGHDIEIVRSLSPFTLFVSCAIFIFPNLTFLHSYPNTSDRSSAFLFTPLFTLSVFFCIRYLFSKTFNVVSCCSRNVITILNQRRGRGGERIKGNGRKRSEFAKSLGNTNLLKNIPTLNQKNFTARFLDLPLAFFYCLERFRDVSPRYFFPWTGDTRVARARVRAHGSVRSVSFSLFAREPTEGEKRAELKARRKRPGVFTPLPASGCTCVAASGSRRSGIIDVPGESSRNRFTGPHFSRLGSSKPNRYP